MNDNPRHDTVGLSKKVPGYFDRKTLWMRLLAALLLAGLSPVILVTVILVRVTSSGPAFFRQTRLGKDGRRFDVIKIRTMYCDAEKVSGPALCMPGDSRITPIGKWLRFLHLDELPQLINVVRGEMCLVGPRPERPAIIARHRLNEIVPGFPARTKVLPGVTGLAQINLPPDQTPECVIPKVRLDLEYIESANAHMDFRILLCTAMRMVGIRHGRAAKILHLHRDAQLYRHPMGIVAEDSPGPEIDRGTEDEFNREFNAGREFEIAEELEYQVSLQRVRPAELALEGEIAG